MMVLVLVVTGAAVLALIATLLVAVMVANAASDVREATPALIVALVLAAALCGFALVLRAF